MRNFKLVVETADPAHDESPRRDLRPPRTRPYERLEPWPLTEETARRLAAAANARQLPFETTGALVVERTLLARDLSMPGRDSFTTALDEIASRMRVERALTEPQSAYLRALSPSRLPAVRTANLPHLLPLPMRLIERIGEGGLDGAVDVTLLESALLWERAAVLNGRTMSEWAALTALKTS